MNPNCNTGDENLCSSMSDHSRRHTITNNPRLDILTSLQDRMGAMHALWQSAASDMNAQQVNYRAGKGVLPLACSFAHCMICEDGIVSWHLLGQESLWAREQWQERVRLAIPVSVAPSWHVAEVLPPLIEGSAWVEVPADVMENQQIGSWDAWQAYQTKVVRQSATALERLTLEQLLEPVAPRLPESWTASYIARLVRNRDTPLRLLDLLEGGVYAHGLRHIGEVEYGRALVGLSGLTM